MGFAKENQIFLLAGGAHQIALSLVVRNVKFDESRPALEAAQRAGKIGSKVLSVDDMGGAATIHGNGENFKEAVPSLEVVVQDSMHQQSRVTRTQQKNHTDHAEATRRLKRCFRAVSEGAYDEVKTVVCHKRFGDFGGLVVKKSSTGRPLYTKLLIGLHPRAYMELRDKDGQCAMTGTKFDEHYSSENRPNEVFEVAFDGAFDYTDHMEATMRFRLANMYCSSARELAPPCGTCDGCLPGEPTDQEVAAARAVRSATNRLAAFQCHRHKQLVAASEAATPHREHDDRVDDDPSICLRAKRLGRFDGKGQLLNSCDAKCAFEAAIRNAKHMPWPQHLCPRQRPIIQGDGKQKCNAVGMPLSYSQAGTNFPGNAFGRAERVLSAKAGYTVDYAFLLSGEFVSRSKTAARRGYLGEADVGHNKLYPLEQINRDYEAIGEPRYYTWLVEPDPYDPGHLYWADYDKRQHPECYKNEPPPPPPAAAHAPRPPPRQLVSASARFYRAAIGGPEVILPPGEWMLGFNLERADDRTLPCPCLRTVTAHRTMRNRQHPLHYCLHGIALRLQQSRGGGARRGKARRDRRS